MLQTDKRYAAKSQATLAHLAEERDERFAMIGTSHLRCCSQSSGLPTSQKDHIIAGSPIHVLDEVQIELPFICLPFMGQSCHRRAQQAFLCCSRPTETLPFQEDAAEKS